MADAVPKTCVICGADCSNKARTKDARGRYYCKACYDQAVSRQHVTPAPSAPPRKAFVDNEDGGEYGLEKTSPTRVAQPTAPVSSQADPRNTSPATGLPPPGATPAVCPSCGRTLPAGSMICVPCGINVQTGRSFVTAEEGDMERTKEHARGILWFASWILVLGLFPISSEAHGARRPYAVRAIAIATILVSMWMWWFEWTGSPRMHVLKDQFLWAGQAMPDEEHIDMFYDFTEFGDRRAFDRMKSELESSVPPHELAVSALKALPHSKQCLGRFHSWQLLTHAMLHGDFLHLLGNLVFMLVFGLRINALIGNLATLVLYPFLAVASGLAQMASMSHEMPTPCLGASGAVMGLAGMYLVLFPVSKVNVAAFLRIIPIFLIGFFKCRGFWILLFFIGWDVLYTVLAVDNGVAHWAHLGGFMAGMAVGLLLLLTRAVNARGNDLISALLGRHAWAIIGKPSQWQSKPEGEGWLTRMTLLPRSVLSEIKQTLRPGPPNP